MNIFFLSFNPREAAEYHCDKHVVKMIIESAQMLYCAHWTINESKLLPNAYKKAHQNHPCTIWVRETLGNYLWLCSLAWWLCKEYTLRYGKVHKTEEHILWLFQNHPCFEQKGINKFIVTNPAQAMPPEYKRKNPIEAYQTFYIESKLKERKIVSYKKCRKPPLFLIPYMEDKENPL